MDVKELQTTAELAHIELRDDELDTLKDAVGEMLEYFSKMLELDVEGLEPTTHALQQENRLRPDLLTFNNPSNNSNQNNNSNNNLNNNNNSNNNSNNYINANYNNLNNDIADNLLENAPELEDRFIAIPNVL